MLGNNSHVLGWCSVIMFGISAGFYVRDFNWLLPFAMAFVLFAFAVDESKKG